MAEKQVGMFFKPSPAPDDARPCPSDASSAERDALERVASSAAAFRDAGLGAIKTLARTREVAYNRAAAGLDGALTELARLRGQTRWPRPKVPPRARPEAGTPVRWLFRSGVLEHPVVGFVDGIEERDDGSFDVWCVGVIIGPSPLPAQSVRWRVPGDELVELVESDRPARKR